MKSYNKIFGIGLSKTGTTSLHYALEILGFKAIHFPDNLVKNSSLKTILRWRMNNLWFRISGSKEKPLYHDILINTNNKLILNKKYSDNYDALTDTPVTFFYKELDELYPGSKFIYTVRDIDNWLNSCKRHFTKLKYTGIMPQLQQELYNTYLFDEEKFKKTYNNHHNDVLNYFKGREKDILIIDITKNKGWNELCGFLDMPVPDKPFPHANKTKK